MQLVFVAMKYQIKVSDPKLFEETPSLKFQLVGSSYDAVHTTPV